MKKSTDVGMNRTGMDTSPVHSREMVEGVKTLMPPGSDAPSTDGGALRVRLSYAEEAEPVATVPPPGTVKGAAKTALQALKGNKATVFIDKLGERLGYERTGVRLYDAVLLKYAANGSWEGGPTEELLKEFRSAELAHMLMLKDCIETLGADPTAMTPHANILAVGSAGLIKVVTDPRTTLADSLEALLAAELLDNAAWEILTSLANTMGRPEMEERFRAANEEEARHLVHVRGWLQRFIQQDASRDIEPTQPTA